MAIHILGGKGIMGAKYNRHDFDLYVQMEWFGLDWMGWLGDWDIYGIYFYGRLLRALYVFALGISSENYSAGFDHFALIFAKVKRRQGRQEFRAKRFGKLKGRKKANKQGAVLSWKCTGLTVILLEECVPEIKPLGLVEERGRNLIKGLGGDELFGIEAIVSQISSA
ncbi:hypothetical protein CEXT_89031 [Caerostris extrusa]|uniref:Uncharacterized protein n=1 Tax=Caerostris extrusa TaxID=172846 RepID=A0AAV4T1S5_CAEEX|nr:hypothetical protein CEXT_89031 [Caerostris extrusa]